MTSLPPRYQVKSFLGKYDFSMLSEIGKLRYLIWRSEPTPLIGEYPDDSWVDELEGDSEHWVVFDSNGELIAAARATTYENLKELPNRDRCDFDSANIRAPVSYLTRDVVLQGHRRKGIGNFLNYVRIQRAEELGISTVIADIPEYRSAVFDKLGFREIRQPMYGIRLPELRWSIVVKSLDKT